MAADQKRRGFTLLEVMLALGILASFMAALETSMGNAVADTIWVMDVSDATQMLEPVVLEIEETYRLDGFPTNDPESKDCAEFLPDHVRKRATELECSYDLLNMDVSTDNIGALGSEANDAVNAAGPIQAMCSGGPSGSGAVDPSVALANLTADGTSLQDPGLIAFAQILDPRYQAICGFKPEKMCQNTALIASFIPMIIEQAARSTRKLVLRLKWGERMDESLEIETFITAVPEAEEES
ncbi:MAG: prepilin-type N-terminal cleavage/methylation domain-containing protein [Myxococcota bacterium]|jgi:prepilin-type N-terminal cleavage/methylation domain-containing protein